MTDWGLFILFTASAIIVMGLLAITGVQDGKGGKQR